MNTRKSKPRRVMVKIDPAHHAALRRRKDELGVSIEASLDEVLGLGLRVKRWMPNDYEN